MEIRKIQFRYFVIGIVLLVMFLAFNYASVVVPFEYLWIYKSIAIIISLILSIIVVYISMDICQRIDCGIFWIILIGLTAILLPGLALIIQYFVKPRVWEQNNKEE